MVCVLLSSIPLPIHRISCNTAISIEKVVSWSKSTFSAPGRNKLRVFQSPMLKFLWQLLRILGVEIWVCEDWDPPVSDRDPTGNEIFVITSILNRLAKKLVGFSTNVFYRWAM